MKKIFLFLSLFLMTMRFAEAQQPMVPEYCNDVSDTTFVESRASGSSYTPYGLQFTPKGDLHILVLFAGFGSRYDTLAVNGWPEGETTLPEYITDSERFPFYTDTTQFETLPGNIKNISRYYYEMSGGKFRLTADILPTRINVDTIGFSQNSNKKWSFFNKKVLEKMSVLLPDFDWSKYDKRTNRPNYVFDNSLSLPDQKPDFIVIVYRYNPGWRSTDQPILGMNGWDGSSGGITPLGLSESPVTYNDYTIDGVTGYTHCFGGCDFTDLFIHEMAHAIFGCPHYANANGVVGNYFYGQHGWGMMSRTCSPFSCTNGWERWWLDWFGLNASGEDTDIKDSLDLNATGEYTLRDFITTGDVLRLKIPNGEGENQYLWLENHRDLSIYDERMWTNDARGIPYPESRKGVTAYIESIGDAKTGSTNGGSNGIKYLHAKGSYDFSFDTTKLYQPNIQWGNYYYHYFEQEMNPIAGQGRNELIRGDYNLDGTIYIVYEGGNEQRDIFLRDSVLTFDAMGSEVAFRPGDKLSMASNPCLVNRPSYNLSAKKLGVCYLNGISVEFQTLTKVKIRFNDVDIDRNTRYTGFVRLPNITSGVETPDIRILPHITLKIDKSGTPNRHTKTLWNDFVNLSEFACSDSAFFKQESNSTVIVEDSTLLVLESGSRYEINDGARLIVRSGSTFMLQSGSELVIKGAGTVDIEPGAFFCIDTTSTVVLTDSFSVINMKYGSTWGYGLLNSFSEYASPVCLTAYGAIKDSGKGSVIQFGDSDYYIQNQNITGTRYIYGRDILVGSDVIPHPMAPKYGVTIKTDANIRMNAQRDVLFQKDVVVEQGASLIVE